MCFNVNMSASYPRNVISLDRRKPRTHFSLIVEGFPILIISLKILYGILFIYYFQTNKLSEDNLLS